MEEPEGEFPAGTEITVTGEVTGLINRRSLRNPLRGGACCASHEELASSVGPSRVGSGRHRWTGGAASPVQPPCRSARSAPPSRPPGNTVGARISRRRDHPVKRSLLVLLATPALSLGLAVPAAASSGDPSCQGLAASSLAGQPGAFAEERRDAFGEAADLGITPGALTSEFARSHEDSLEACFG